MTHIAIPEVFYITLALWLLTQFMHQTQMSSYPSSYSREKRKKKLQNVTICIRLKQWHNSAGPCCEKKNRQSSRPEELLRKRVFQFLSSVVCAFIFKAFCFMKEVPNYGGSGRLG